MLLGGTGIKLSLTNREPPRWGVARHRLDGDDSLIESNPSSHFPIICPEVRPHAYTPIFQESMRSALCPRNDLYLDNPAKLLRKCLATLLFPKPHRDCLKPPSPHIAVGNCEILGNRSCQRILACLFLDCGIYFSGREVVVCGTLAITSASCGRKRV